MNKFAAPILTGWASRRAAGVRKELQRRADTALAASRTAEDERAAAALRGKARGLREAVELVRALETGRAIGHRRRSPRPCAYYMVCSNPARTCGFCETHCLCGALPNYRDRCPKPTGTTES